jgi:hypothetical protein
MIDRKYQQGRRYELGPKGLLVDRIFVVGLNPHASTGVRVRLWRDLKQTADPSPSLCSGSG